VLGWAPADFWRATPHDLDAALGGFAERHGAGSAGGGRGRRAGGGGAAMTRAEFEDLKRKLARRAGGGTKGREDGHA